MNGFYKLDGHLIGPVKNVYNTNYVFHISNVSDYNLPHDGWYYFESEEEAKSFFQIVEEDTIGESEPWH